MSLKKIIFVVLFLSVAYLSDATMLRGAIQGYNPYTGYGYAYSGAYVELLAWNGYTWITSVYTYTGMDGFYYFNAPPGKYYLRVNNTYSYPLQVANVPNQDIPVINL